MTEHIVTLTKLTKRNLQDDVIVSQFATVCATVNTKSLKVRGWDISTGIGEDGKFWAQDETEPGQPYKYLYTVRLSVVHEGTRAPEKADLAAIVRSIYSAAKQPVVGVWTLATVDGKGWVTPKDGESGPVPDELIEYTSVEIPENWEDEFTHLYGLDSHVRRVLTSIQAAVASDWINRFHCALIGPPGCGKSDIARSWQRVLGDEAVWEFDATAMTAAGAIKMLDEAEILPRVLVVEEIEKAPENALTFLLALCDLRGEIRKTTARSNIRRDTKLLVIATVNDYDLFQKLNAGALASRFANRIFFKHPDQALLSKILVREVQKIGGDVRWVQPALDYCEEMNIHDPRSVIAICLCGREMLLSGEYQAMMRETGEGIRDGN